MDGHIEGDFTDGISNEVHSAMYGTLDVSHTLVDCRMTSWVKKNGGLTEGDYSSVSEVSHQM